MTSGEEDVVQRPRLCVGDEPLFDNMRERVGWNRFNSLAFATALMTADDRKKV